MIIDPKPIVAETPVVARVEPAHIHQEEKPVHAEQKHVQHAHTEKKHVEPVDIVQQVLEDKLPLTKASQDVSSEKVHDKHEHHEHVDNEKSDTHTDSHAKPKTVHTPKAPKEPKTPKAPKEAKQPKVPKIEYDFFTLILNHVASKKLDVISKEKIKKTEYDLILKNHDNNEYIYCKAKDKDTISEGDLAPALIFAQNKKMPCLFLSTGALSQRAESMIHTEFNGMTFEHILVSQ